MGLSGPIVGYYEPIDSDVNASRKDAPNFCRTVGRLGTRADTTTK